jgi:hypothetical protein
MTAGDNLYPVIPDSPTDEEFELMLSLFKYPYLNDLTVNAVRGNHDCVFDWQKELELTNVYDKWHMPSLFYKEEYDIGDGKKMGVLYIDSCFLLCSNYSYSDDVTSAFDNIKLGRELIELKDKACDDIS